MRVYKLFSPVCPTPGSVGLRQPSRIKVQQDPQELSLTVCMKIKEKLKSVTHMLIITTIHTKITKRNLIFYTDEILISVPYT